MPNQETFKSGVRKGLNYALIKWTLFMLLLLISPALLFLVQAFMFIPAIFFGAGILYMVPKAFVPSHTLETLTFVAFFGAHVVTFVGLYFFLSVVLSKLLCLIRSYTIRGTLFARLCLSILSLSLFPIYGGGGHGPARWGTLFDLFQEVNRDYGQHTVIFVYGVSVLCFVALVLHKTRRRGRERSKIR